MAGLASRVEPTIEELIATLSHSSLPTLIIEGKDDLIIFRRLEEQADNLSLSVLPVGGRTQVLTLFERLSEVRSGQPIAFIADLDLWVFSGVPTEYRSDKLLFTDGYSIENDAFRDIDCERLLFAREKQAFYDEMKIFAEWYALAVSRSSHIGRMVDVHPNRILNFESERTRMMKLEPLEEYPKDLYEKILADYGKFLRGKSLFELFQRQMNGVRAARHNRKALLEMAGVKPGALIQSLFDRAEALLVL
jgi:hypothetical protein